MQNGLDTDWWSELKFYNFYSATPSIEDIKIIDELYNRSSDILNSITKDLYHFCDTVKYVENLVVILILMTQEDIDVRKSFKIIQPMKEYDILFCVFLVSKEHLIINCNGNLVIISLTI